MGVSWIFDSVSCLWTTQGWQRGCLNECVLHIPASGFSCQQFFTRRFSRPRVVIGVGTWVENLSLNWESAEAPSRFSEKDCWNGLQILPWTRHEAYRLRLLCRLAMSALGTPWGMVARISFQQNRVNLLKIPDSRFRLYVHKTFLACHFRHQIF